MVQIETITLENLGSFTPELMDIFFDHFSDQIWKRSEFSGIDLVKIFFLGIKGLDI